jgi:HEAT repeat protein
VLRCPTAIVGLILLVTLPGAVAQETPGAQIGSVRLSRFGDLLREHHIELTEPALLQALKNRDPEVRFLAAMQLAEDKAADAIPEVKEALASEKVPRTRVNIAVALGLLGDPGGHEEMRRLCADQSFPPEFRLYAVRYMFDLHVENNSDCLHAAEQIVATVDADYHTIGHRNMALQLLPQFRDLTPQESEKVFQLVVGRLDDPEPTVRMQASQALVDLGKPATAVRYIEAAAGKEKEESVLRVFEKNLEKLKGGPKGN